MTTLSHAYMARGGSRRLRRAALGLGSLGTGFWLVLLTYRTVHSHALWKAKSCCAIGEPRLHEHQMALASQLAEIGSCTHSETSEGGPIARLCAKPWLSDRGEMGGLCFDGASSLTAPVQLLYKSFKSYNHKTTSNELVSYPSLRVIFARISSIWRRYVALIISRAKF